MSQASGQPDFLPNLCAIRVLFVWVLTAQLLAVVLTLAAAPADLWASLSLHSLYLQWIALTLAALLCPLRKPLQRLGNTVAGILSWLMVLMVTLVVFLLAQTLTHPAPIDWPELARQIAIAAIVGALGIRYLYELYRQQERELAEARARAEALQARIRPHFLFNSMNTIANLTRVDPALAEELVFDLSDLFRASLAESGQWSTLGRELELSEGYLRIEAQRLGGRLRVRWDIDELPRQALLPPLLLQPLLENAVYHGIEPALEGGDIEVVGRFRRGLLNIAISNSLPPQASDRQGNRMAQQNVRERLRAAFPEQGEMHIGRVDGRYQVRLALPLRETPA